MLDQSRVDLPETQPRPKPPVGNPPESLSAIWIVEHINAEAVEAVSAYLALLRQLPLKCQFVTVINGNIELGPEITSQLGSCDLSVSIVKIHRHTDESAAIRAGLQAVTGEILALLPGYRQVDEHAIVDMLDELQKGYDYIASWRHPRIDSRWSVLTSRIFNFLTRRLTGGSLHDVNSGLRLMRRRVMDDLPFYGDMHRFLPMLADRQGYRVSEVSVKHVHEQVKKGDYRFGVFSRRVLDLMSLFFLSKFAKKPLRFFGLVGNFFLAAGTVVMLYVAIERMFGVSLSDRPALLFGVLLVVLGVQLFSLGLLGELIIFVHGRNVRDNFVETVYERKDLPSDGDRV